MPAAGIPARSAVPSTTELSPIWHPSPNFSERRDGLTPSLVVIHYTAMNSAKAALDRLCDPASEVSAHFLIGGDGTLWQMVREEDRAWHAGAGEWEGQTDINSRSVGIELDSTGSHPFSEPQMSTLEALLPRIMKSWSIPASGVIGHSDMAPGRKSDPGPHFDWQRLERQALAKPRAPVTASATPSPEAFRAAARRAGFTAPVDDTQLLAAVRLRFRPWAQGPLETGDLNALIPPGTIT
ncbi:N-acetylmuramoyl-L-alanine amidase [Ruegeria sp. 6PALISEP08]|uniref:N-acetylmuramoyl-L-alanine amidase n=1 Tax=Ruegeria sp. 6PALISEP08 TaxID=1225660 RepID=UPI00067F5448|nr:N-acetylmuramoyl-L-alanine amidase [Ruegeria sp. 6PALISEP08]